MRAVPFDQEGFCDHSALARIRRRMSLVCGEPAFLILSGSFNPVHTQHVRAFDVARKHVEGLGLSVVGGFLAPSGGSYLQSKLGEAAMSLEERIDLCKLAIGGHDWMSVCLKEEFSSNTACRAVRSELERHCLDVAAGRRITGVEIMGSDTVVRIFSKILAEKSKATSTSTQRGRFVCCLLRPGKENAIEKNLIAGVFIPEAAKLGIELTLVTPTVADPPLESVSSTVIRQLLLKRDWQTLRSTGWLHPAVFDNLKKLAS